MTLPSDYIAVLERLGAVFTCYRECTGHDAVLVGGAANAFDAAMAGMGIS